MELYERFELMVDVVLEEILKMGDLYQYDRSIAETPELFTAHPTVSIDALLSGTPAHKAYLMCEALKRVAERGKLHIPDRLEAALFEAISAYSGISLLATADVLYQRENRRQNPDSNLLFVLGSLEEMASHIMDMLKEDVTRLRSLRGY